MPVKKSLLCLVSLLLSPAAFSQAAVPVGTESILVRSEEPAHSSLYTPSIIRMDTGRLVAAYEIGDRRTPKDAPYAFVLTSDDGGKNWTRRGSARINHGRLFEAGKSLYYLGHERDLRIMRSDDTGETWSQIFQLTRGQRWHQSACNVWYARGNVYLVMERIVDDRIRSWPVGAAAPVLMRASVDDDLTNWESWTLADELAFQDIIPGYRENDLEIDFTGLPFFPQSYPGRHSLANRRSMAPMGWLEANVVQILDPEHYWHDPNGRTFHLFLRAHTGGTGYAALAKVIENADGSMTTSLEKVPSGKTALFLPFPGGHMRFHVLHDEPTRLYWMVGSQATDSMTRIEQLPADRYDLPLNERNRLVLHFSKNMVDWCFAGLVAKGGGNKESRHYASMAVDGDDLVILSRSGDAEARTAHDGNLITFHRVKDFRKLVY
ncbi:hypothetical protein OPIT5_29170 [Opitutaceae bacterium TAV5]|nr:hypothetical protein OPIT5_29170 [Opitutaceae bacterium TAV5]